MRDTGCSFVFRWLNRQFEIWGHARGLVYLECVSADVEITIREMCSRRAFKEATTLVLQKYGPEIAAYLRAITDQNLVDPAFSDFAVDLWRGLPGFQWRCSARGFAFTLARRAAFRAYRAERRTSQYEQLWATERWLLAAIEQTRTSTPHHLRSEVKTHLRALRDRLTEEERTLLVLRVDRQLSFSDLAVVLSSDPEVGDAVSRARIEARLRKRFQALKDKLRRMVVEHGLIQGHK